MNTEIEVLKRVLTDESPSGFWRRRRASQRLAHLATSDKHTSSLSPVEARTVVEGLAAGLEGVHWDVQRRCRRALERLRAPQLIEAVCHLLIEQDLPRLRTLAVHHRYAPTDPMQEAAYLYVLGRLQFYESADPQGQLLAQFYVAASPALRDRLLGLARSRGGPHEGQLIAARLRQAEVGTLSAAEIEVTLAVISQPAWYALYDPEGELLVQCYAAVVPEVRGRLWERAQLREEPRWGRLVTAIQRERGWAGMSDVEVEAAVASLRPTQRWEAVWSLVVEGRLPWSWRGVRILAETGWQPQEGWAAHCCRELMAVAQAVPDPMAVVARDGWEQVVLRGHQDTVWALAGSPDGQWLASGSEDKTIRLWELLGGGAEQAVLRGHQSRIQALAGSPDGQWLASGSLDSTIRLWELPRGVERAALRRHQGSVNALAVSPDGQWLASGSKDKTIRLWRLPGGTEQAVLRGHQGSVNALAVSPDGQWLASSSGDGTIRLWGLPGGTEQAVLRGHQNSVNALAVSPDGQWLASGSWDGTIRLWALPEGIERAVLPGHPSAVWVLAGSPDGQWLASGSWDGTIQLWRLPEGEERAVLRGHQSRVQALAGSPDGQWLASGDWDGTIRLWELGDMSQVLRVPLGHMGQTEYERMQRWANNTLLSPERRAVARYVAAVLRYRLRN